jgi:hypothetical protein
MYNWKGRSKKKRSTPTTWAPWVLEDTDRSESISGELCVHVLVAVVVVVVAVVVVEAVSVAVAVTVVVAEFVSSASGGNAGSTLFAGGEGLFGKLAFDKVGELVDCVGMSGGVPDTVEDCWASFARLLV